MVENYRVISSKLSYVEIPSNKSSPLLLYFPSINGYQSHPWQISFHVFNSYLGCKQAIWAVKYYMLTNFIVVCIEKFKKYAIQTSEMFPEEASMSSAANFTHVWQCLVVVGKYLINKNYLKMLCLMLFFLDPNLHYLSELLLFPTRWHFSNKCLLITLKNTKTLYDI